MASYLTRFSVNCRRILVCTKKSRFAQITWSSSRSGLGKPGEYRIDKDTLGEVKVPADKYYGSETTRSIQNFPSGGDYERMPFPLISAIGIIKKAAANANTQYGLDCQIAEAIVKASEEVISGDLYCEHFPLVVWQAGASTNSHINANEVIANRAIEIMGGEIGSKCPVHPNDHVNMGQSTNDVIPSAIHIALALELHNNTLPGVKLLQDELYKKAEEWACIIKVGRTHLMDAVPISLGQEFCGYACQIKDSVERVEATLPGLYQIPMGGTAVGTQLNAACGYRETVTKLIADYTGLPFVPTPDNISACACMDHVVHLSAALSTLGCSLMKVANDIRHMASGPRCGIGELFLPEKEPGSSIMPGKVNPTQCEPVLMISTLAMGNHAATTIAGSLGNWELNVYKPLIFANTLRTARLMGHVCKAFTNNCVKGMKPNVKRMKKMVNNSLMLVTALNPHVGYDKAAKIAVLALKENLSLMEAAKREGISRRKFRKWVNPQKMISCTEHKKDRTGSCEQDDYYKNNEKKTITSYQTKKSTSSKRKSKSLNIKEPDCKNPQNYRKSKSTCDRKGMKKRSKPSTTTRGKRKLHPDRCEDRGSSTGTTGAKGKSKQPDCYDLGNTGKSKRSTCDDIGKKKKSQTTCTDIGKKKKSETTCTDIGKKKKSTSKTCDDIGQRKKSQTTCTDVGKKKKSTSSTCDDKGKKKSKCD